MWEGIAGAILGVIVGGVGSYLLVRWQIIEARRIAKANLLLQFDQQMAQYSAVHKALRPGGSWVEGTKPEDIHWADVDGYMGLFERLYVLIDDGIVDAGIAQRFYGYRLRNLVMNEGVYHNKLVAERAAWTDFMSLCARLGVTLPE